MIIAEENKKYMILRFLLQVSIKIICYLELYFK